MNINEKFRILANITFEYEIFDEKKIELSVVLKIQLLKTWILFVTLGLFMLWWQPPNLSGLFLADVYVLCDMAEGSVCSSFLEGAVLICKNANLVAEGKDK